MIDRRGDRAGIHRVVDAVRVISHVKIQNHRISFGNLDVHVTTSSITTVPIGQIGKR